MIASASTSRFLPRAMLAVTMPFHLTRPGPPLDTFVDCFWSVQETGGLERDKVLPNGVLELIINLGACHHGVVDPRAPTGVRPYREAWIAGLQERWLLIDSVWETDLVGIRFKPGGAYPFLRLSMAELTNRVLEWTELEELGIPLLREELLACTTTSKRYTLLERYLTRRLDLERGLAPWLMETLAELQIVRQPRRIRDISRNVGLTHRQLIDRFRTEVGLTPKHLARVYRLQAVISAVGRSSRVPWSQVARDCGYADQPHMIRDFRELADATPSEYLAQRYLEDSGHMMVI